MSSPILVVGSFIQDLTFHVSEFPAPGETLLGQFVTGPGGKGSNQAVAAARTGVPTAYVGAVGNDAFGDGAEKFHAAERIDHHFLRIADFPTGTAGITVDAAGQNCIVVALGASGQFAAEEVDESLMREAEVLVLQFEIHPATVRDLLQKGRALGKTTVLNPAPMNALTDWSLLEWVDILIPNETEFVTMVRQHPKLSRADFSEEIVAAMSEADLHTLCREIEVPVLIVTLGKRGCFISQLSGCTLLPACAGIQALDTTGAGDAFVGGFASGLVQFAGDVIRAARYGNVVAGLSVTKRGTAPAMPQRAEIEAWIAAENSATDRHR